jgi:hypothetical protein
VGYIEKIGHEVVPSLSSALDALILLSDVTPAYWDVNLCTPFRLSFVFGTQLVEIEPFLNTPRQAVLQLSDASLSSSSVLNALMEVSHKGPRPNLEMAYSTVYHVPRIFFRTSNDICSFLADIGRQTSCM